MNLKMNEQIDYHKLYMNFANLISKCSKDPHTKVGAVIVSKDSRLLSVGFNDGPNSFKNIPWNKRKGEITKYDYVIHAEMNCILNYQRSSLDFKDAEIYVNISPCIRCACVLANKKIKRVYYLKEYKDFKYSKEVLDSAGIELINLK